MGRLRKAIFFTFVSSLFLILGGCYSEVPEDGDSAPKLSQIEITKNANKLIYHKGEALDTSGLEVTAIYRSGHTKVVSGWEVRGFDSSVDRNSQQLTVYYEENGISRITGYQIEYSNLSSLTVTTPPRKTKYRVGDYAGFDDYKNRDFLNLVDLVLTVSRTDGSSEVIDVASIESDVLKKDDSGRVMIEFLNADGMSGPCTKYYDIPKTKTIDLGNNRSLVFSGFAFVKEDTNPQINIEYTEDCNGEPLTRTASFGISVNYEPPYKFTDEPCAVDNAANHYYLGDYPQTAKADDVIVCTKSMDRGYFKYYVGNDGNYYVKLNSGGEYYFKVEPIEWFQKIADDDDKISYYMTKKGIEGGIPFTPGNSPLLYQDNRTFETIAKNYEETDGRHNYYTSLTWKFYLLSGTYKKSFIADFLNGTNENGSGLYSGKGFYQTAFSSEAGNYVRETTVSESFYYSQMEVYTDYGDSSKDYWDYLERWDDVHGMPIPYTQKVVLPDDFLCKDASAWELTDYAKQKNVIKNYMVNKTSEGPYITTTRAMHITNSFDQSRDTGSGTDVFYLDESMALNHTAVTKDDLCIIPCIQIRGK